MSSLFLKKLDETPSAYYTVKHEEVDAMSFSEQLKKARLESGYTQQQVADLMGITNSTYCGYETGKRQPDVEKIRLIAKLLNTSGDILLETGFDINGTEKAPAPKERELTEKDKQIMAMLPYVPDAVKEGILLILDATVDIAAAEESANSHIDQAYELRVQADDAEKQAARNG